MRLVSLLVGLLHILHAAQHEREHQQLSCMQLTCRIARKSHLAHHIPHLHSAELAPKRYLQPRPKVVLQDCSDGVCLRPSRKT